MNMRRVRKVLLVGAGIALLLVAVLGLVVFRPVNDGRSAEQRRQIAEACLSMLRSPLTNEVDLKPDDPRVPEVIRALHPVDIELAGSDAVVMCAGRPAEYHLSRRPSQPKTWILYVAGPGYLGHREILRMEHD
jgi:hypothetical protein